jgi:4-hydroxy-3-methylbut-2-enyl diphosphate reductase
MKVVVGKYAGFCFGVDRAIKIVYNEIGTSNHIVTYGPIIHNSAVVEDLESRGVRIISQISELQPDETVIIRSHGVASSVYDEIANHGNSYIDATCPFVTKIHKIVQEKSCDGYTILVAGDKTHAEVQGVVGHCVGNDVHTFSSLDELKTLMATQKGRVAVVSQTTFNTNVWQRCEEFLKSVPNVEVFNTICNATSSRQSESVELAKHSDVMIVVGGKNSSNTKKLYTICCERCAKCFHIESVSELQNIDFGDAQNIGITAGASTPAYIIKEVQVHMENLKNNVENEINENEDFGALLDQFSKKNT